MEIEQQIVERTFGPGGFRTNCLKRDKTQQHFKLSELRLTREITRICRTKSDHAINSKGGEEHLPFDDRELIRGPPKFRANTFFGRCRMLSRQPTEIETEKVVYASTLEGFNSRSNSPTYKKLSEARSYLLRAINIEMMDRFGCNHSLHSMETMCNPETDSISISMHNICSYRGVKYPDTIFTRAVSERNSDWAYGPPVETVDEFKHPLLNLTPPKPEPEAEKTVKRTVLKLPDIGVLISPVRVKFRGNLHYAYKLADEMRHGDSQINFDKWIEELKRRRGIKDETPEATEPTLLAKEADLEIDIDEEFKERSYMINLTEAMNRIESRLRSATLEDDHKTHKGEHRVSKKKSTVETTSKKCTKDNDSVMPKTVQHYPVPTTHASKQRTSKSKKAKKKKHRKVVFYPDGKHNDDISGAVAFVSPPSVIEY